MPDVIYYGGPAVAKGTFASRTFKARAFAGGN
jgi:hypothetical protein